MGGGGGKVAPGGRGVGATVGAAVGAMPVAHGVGPWLKRHCTKLHLPSA